MCRFYFQGGCWLDWPAASPSPLRVVTPAGGVDTLCCSSGVLPAVVWAACRPSYCMYGAVVRDRLGCGAGRDLRWLLCPLGTSDQALAGHDFRFWEGASISTAHGCSLPHVSLLSDRWMLAPCHGPTSLLLREQELTPSPASVSPGQE